LDFLSIKIDTGLIKQGKNDGETLLDKLKKSKGEDSSPKPGLQLIKFQEGLSSPHILVYWF